MPKPLAVAMDVDGTLAGADHVLSARTRAVVSQLASRGVTAIIVTGRTERSALALARSLGLTAPVIASNGAIVTDPSSAERLKVQAMLPAEALGAVIGAEELGCQPILWTVDHPCGEAESPYTRLLETLLDEPVTLRSLREVIASEPVIKAMIGGSPEQLDAVGPALEAAIPGVERSMPEFYEAAPAGASKKEALDWVLARLGIRHGDCVGIGDGGNDVAWMSSMGRAVAPANARPALLAIADEVIGHHDADGVADYLDRTILLN